MRRIVQSPTEGSANEGNHGRLVVTPATRLAARCSQPRRHFKPPQHRPLESGPVCAASSSLSATRSCTCAA